MVKHYLFHGSLAERIVQTDPRGREHTSVEQLQTIIFTKKFILDYTSREKYRKKKIKTKNILICICIYRV